jgi:hypothetical protein
MKPTPGATASPEGHEIQVSFEAVLAQYERARSKEPFGKQSALWSEFDRIATGLRASREVARFKNIVIKWSAGQGRWATVPWIAALDSRETSRTSEGVYVIYLFRADLSGVYLTLNQGTMSLLEGRRNVQLRERAAQLRKRSGSLKDSGFEVSEGIDLKSDAQLIRGYQDSTVAYKLYSRNQIPGDIALLRDLAAVLAVYEKLVPSRRFLSLHGGHLGDEE